MVSGVIEKQFKPFQNSVIHLQDLNGLQGQTLSCFLNLSMTSLSGAEDFAWCHPSVAEQIIEYHWALHSHSTRGRSSEWAPPGLRVPGGRKPFYLWNRWQILKLISSLGGFKLAQRINIMYLLYCYDTLLMMIYFINVVNTVLYLNSDVLECILLCWIKLCSVSFFPCQFTLGLKMTNVSKYLSLMIKKMCWAKIIMKCNEWLVL